MKKGFIAVLICVLAVVCIIAYEPSKESGSQLPAGVNESGSYQYYVVSIPAGKKVTDYFELTGAEGTIVTALTDVSTYYKDMDTIYYRQVAGGGWVAYIKSQTERFIYMPVSFPEEKVMMTASRLALNIANKSENCMSIEAAKQYIPKLGE